MSYYLLPKNNNNVCIMPTIDSNVIKSYTSHSLYNFNNESKKQLDILIQSENLSIVFKNLLKNINPYEYIFSKVPGSKYSVSKLNTKSNIFYDLLEIIITLNLFYKIN